MKQTEFFLVTLPGLEELALKELQVWLPEAEAQTVHGGIEFHATFDQGLALNRCLKIPTRLLLRITRFKCRDFPKLFNKIEKLDWEEWVDLRSQVKVTVSSSKSRLNIKKRIEKTVEEAWRKAQKKRNLTPLNRQVSIYVRFFEDLCTLSLDTSGERLHKRGLEKHIGEAPLRETLASAIIQFLSEEESKDSQVEVIDPMMGSGTLLSEALKRDQVISEREFSFESFKQASVTLLQPQMKRPQIEKVIGYERDLKTFKAALKNFEGEPCEIIHKDFFDSTPRQRQNLRRWVVCNPPYGRRLKVKGSLKNFYEKLILYIDKNLNPDLCALLLPAEDFKGKLILPREWKTLKKIRLSNGGIPVHLFIFQKQL